MREEINKDIENLKHNQFEINSPIPNKNLIESLAEIPS
jgi:hypothetical protein